MVKNIRIKQIHTNSLACEPMLRRTQNGELLCVCQCDGPFEPHIDNRVYAFHSKDNGETWSERENIYPEDGNAVYCTELSVEGDEITAYLTVHSGRFLNWKCVMMKSFDNGYTWENCGAPPHFSEYTFIRSRIHKSNGDILIPYQYYPVTQEGRDRVLNDDSIQDKAVWWTKPEYCESGVLISSDNGQNYERYAASRMDMSGGWIWSEPTIVELWDGRIAMLMRKDLSGYLWYTESKDGGKNWSDTIKTDIPNPANKPRLIKYGDKIALIHTPNSVAGWGGRYPLSLWISDDDMKTWKYKTNLTDFPGSYCYTDGFYEDGHIIFAIEHNRHSILFIDVELIE